MRRKKKGKRKEIKRRKKDEKRKITFAFARWLKSILVWDLFYLQKVNGLWIWNICT